MFLTWSNGYVIIYATNDSKFAIADTNIYLTFVSVSSKDNTELL